MGTVAAIPSMEQGTPLAVRTCYDLLEVMHAAGLSDFTDGKYVGDLNDREAYLSAQERQAEFLLDQALVGPGSRLLDIGCGYGRVLEHAVRRGAQAVGITISPPQVAWCRARGLEVHELDYRGIRAPGGGKWDRSFNAIIANGSLEHFVQPSDALAGRTTAIYQEMFGIFRRLLTADGRLVTTAIHFRKAGQFDPAEIVRGPERQSPASDAYHFALLTKWFGGWYPEPGQLEHCALGSFKLAYEEDGTHDYLLTSEYWLRHAKSKLAYDPRVWWAAFRQFRKHPRAAREMLRLLIWDQSWAWQFRPPPPMKLLRQTWAPSISA